MHDRYVVMVVLVVLVIETCSTRGPQPSSGDTCKYYRSTTTALRQRAQIYGGLRKTLRDAAVFLQRRPVWVEHHEGRALTLHEEPLDAERALVEAAGE